MQDMPCLSTDAPQPTPLLLKGYHTPKSSTCVYAVCCSCMYVCVCMCVCVCVCVCWPRRVQKTPRWPSDHGLVPTRSGGCTPRVWPTPCGADFERNANPTLCTCHQSLPVQPTSRRPICFPLIVGPLPCAPRWWLDPSIRGNKLIHTYTH